jgi:ATP-dependent DNA helicase RecG
MVERGILEEGAQKSTQKGAQKSTQKTSDMILAILTANPSSTMARMAEELGIHPSAVKKHLRNLKKQGRLRRIGPDKGGRWEVMS